MATPAILGSWKEIAQFLGKGVRTVQRWERELKLPVHRPSGARKGVVIAFPDELGKWARYQSNNGNPEIRREQLQRIHASSALLLERTEALRRNLQRVQDECLKAQTWAEAHKNANGQIRSTKATQQTSATRNGNSRD